MKTLVALLALASSAAHAACNCSVPSTAGRCTQAQLAQAESRQVHALQSAFAARQLRPDFTKNTPLTIAAEPDLKKLFQESRRIYGDKAVSAALGMPLSKVTPQSFSDIKFARELNQAAGVLHPAGGSFILKWLDDSNKMTLGGTKTPNGFPLPNKLATGYVPTTGGGGCWIELGDPLKPSASGTQVQGAFGSNFPEVGRIVRVDTRQGLEVDRVCAFVMLSPRWAVTALHCVADQPQIPGSWQLGRFRSPGASNDWTGERALFLGQADVGKALPAKCLGLPGQTPCPWTMLRVDHVKPYSLEADSANPRLPKDDIALVRLANDLNESFDFPHLIKSTQSEGTVTLVAFGTATPPFEAFLDLQVGWNRAGSATDDGRKFTWNPSKSTGQSSICPGDSGGALFTGFENGGCSCGSEGSRRELAGIVSFLRLPDNFNNLQIPTRLQRCMDSSHAGAVQTAAYRTWICTHVPEAGGCK